MSQYVNILQAAYDAQCLCDNTLSQLSCLLSETLLLFILDLFYASLLFNRAPLERLAKLV